MDQAGTFLSTNPAQVLAVVEKSMNQCPGKVTRGRVDHHSRWLVHYQQTVIFVDNLQWNGLRFNLQRGRGWKIKVDPVIQVDSVTGFNFLSIDRDMAVLNQPLDTRT
jgi:hypothetical protein